MKEITQFKIGDRITILPDSNNKNMTRKSGVVKCLIHSPDHIGIRFDEFHSNLHNLDGRCESGYGYYITVKHVKLLSESIVFPIFN